MAEKEYIERDAARPDAFCEGVSCQECPFCKNPIKGGCRVEDFIKAIPAADVVEVVRCRECIYWEPASPTRTSGNCNRSFDIPAWANDFCSYGKRKDGGQDDV